MAVWVTSLISMVSASNRRTKEIAVIPEVAITCAFASLAKHRHPKCSSGPYEVHLDLYIDDLKRDQWRTLAVGGGIYWLDVLTSSASIDVSDKATPNGGHRGDGRTFGLPHPTVARAVEFLLSTGHLKSENGYYAVGEANTYVGRDSRSVAKHHLNWRLKAIEQLDYIPEVELVFTNSIAISHKDFLKICEHLVTFLETYKER